MQFFHNQKSKGKAKFVYAAPSVIANTIHDEDLPDGLKKEFTINQVLGKFNIEKETFLVSFNFHQNNGVWGPVFEFMFNGNEVEGGGNNVFHAKLKSLQGDGCIVS